MKKKMMKRVVSFVLAMVMVLTSVLIGGAEEAKAAELTPEEVTLTNADFSASTSEISGWTFEGKDDSTSTWMYMQDYTSAYANKPDSTATDYAVKFVSSADKVLNLKQTIDVLPAGKYTVSVPIMGAGASIKLGLNGTYSEVSYLDDVSGWNAWYTKSYTFIVTEKVENAVLDISLECWSGGYGFIDRVDFKGENNDGYKVSVTADYTTVEQGGVVTLTSTVTYNGKNVTLGDDYKLWFWEAEGEGDSWYSDTTGTSLTNVVTLPSAGTYKINAELKDSTSRLDMATIELTATAPADVYTVEVSADKESVTAGETVSLTAVVKKNGEAVTDLTGLELWFWADQWAEGHEDGLVNSDTVTNLVVNGNTGATLTDTVTLKTAGKYYMIAELKVPNADSVKDCVTLTATAATNAGGQETTPETEEEVKEEEKVVEKPVVIELDNSNFSTATDGTWTGEIANGEWQDGNDMQVLSYSSDSYLELPDYVGTTGLKFNMEQGNTMTISQWVETLKAGTYTITAPVMGENTDVYLVLGDKEIKATSLSGYNSWTKAKATFKITEDMTDVKVGFKLVATSSGSDSWSWGWIDSIQLIKTVPGTGDTTNAYAYVILMMAGLAIVGYSVKRNKVQF
ncbi:MAG: hypothetical protein J6I97_02125 [Agathobacter sp.]|nr:hypothetical protein [Agathobacter sp.]